MKECPKCHSMVSDTTNFCPECGDQFPASKSDTAIILSTPKAIQKPEEVSKGIKTLNRDDAALVFVYIAQYARPDGPGCAGVLVECAGKPVDDCSQHVEGIHNLIIQGAVQEKNWNKLRGYITTTEGNRRAALIIQQRLEQAEDTLKTVLNSLPARFVQFFRDEVMKAEDSEGARNVSKAVLELRERDTDTHFCLLSNNNVKRLRDDLMTTLINQGLAETPHTYVVSHGGRVDSKVYSLAPEVAVFFDKYLMSAGKLFAGPLFDKNLEAKHRVYHQLSDGITFGDKNYLDNAALVQLRMIQGALKADLRRVFNNLYLVQAISIDPSRVFIKNTGVFLDVVRQEFLSPLVDNLLSPFSGKNLELAGPSTSVVNTVNTTKLVRVEQIDLLFGESDNE
jgi:RNA polymerase subunit RPABC4/transcription elongation factor Spt4